MTERDQQGIQAWIFDGNDPELRAAWAKKTALQEKIEAASGSPLGFITIALYRRELREVDRTIGDIGRQAFRAAGPRRG